MAGRLGEWSVEDLLQIAKITQKTTSIELIGESRSGVIYLREGGVVHAEFLDAYQPGGDRFSRVVEVIVALAGIEVGSFQFGTRDVPFSDERPIDIKSVFAALEKDLAREKRLVDSGISGFEGLGVSRHVAEPLTLKPAVWQLIADLIEPFSLTDLERRVGRRKAVAMVLTLDAIGVLSRDVELPVLADRRPQGQDGGPGPIEASAESEPVESEPVESEPVEMEPVESEPVEMEPVEMEPVEMEPVEMEPVEMPEVAVGPAWADEATWARAGLADQALADQPMETDVEAGSQSDPDQIEVMAVDSERSGDAYGGEPIVEVFGDSTRTMHEVVTPSETTLVSDVLGDLRSRFRSGRGQTLEPGYDE